MEQAGQLQTPIAVEVVRNGLTAIADEMAATHVRAAYSSVVRDMLDFSTAVCDGQGRVLAQGLSLALQLGAIPRFMRHLTKTVTTPRPGDVFLSNHPWEGGVHLPDFFFAKPVFFGDEDAGARPAAYTVIVSHMVDVGGHNPGGASVNATSLWDEGLVIPLVPLVRDGEASQPLLDVISANSRDPAKVLGDIRAVLAGLETGARQFVALADRTGHDELLTHMQALLDSTERATRAAISQLPDTEGVAVDHLDDDGLHPGPIRFQCRAWKDGDTLCFDYSGTDEQVAAGINTTIADVMSAITFAARAALGGDLPVNDGFCRCLRVHVPDGAIINARYPAAVGARAASIYRMTDVALAALAELATERIPANDGGPAAVYFSGPTDDGRNWIFLDYVQAGWGAVRGGDGVPGVSHPISNAANIPVETIEEEFPLRVVRYGLLGDTAGAGEQIGAAAVVREYEILADDTQVDFRTDRRVHPPAGVKGGRQGSPSRMLVRRAGGDWEPLPAKGIIRVGRGDRVRVELASGGGYGDSTSRRADLVRRDLSDGVFTEAAVHALFAAQAPPGAQEGAAAARAGDHVPVRA